MVDGTGDPVGQAAARLEAAVEALGRALAKRLATTDDMVPRAEVAAVADRLDGTLARLRTAIADELRRDEDGEEEP